MIVVMVTPDEIQVELVPASDFAGLLNANQIGLLYAWQEHQDGSFTAYSARCLDSIAPADQARFRRWAAAALEELLETNAPAAHGWFPSERYAGRWYKVASEYNLP